MGTRSLTKFYDTCNSTRTPLVTVYRQMDGYPSGHGLELAKFLKSKRIVNGLGGDDTGVANGTGFPSTGVWYTYDENYVYLHINKGDTIFGFSAVGTNIVLTTYIFADDLSEQDYTI